MKESPLFQFVIFGFAIIAFILLVKFGASMLPDSGGIVGSLRRVLLTV